MEHRMEEMYAEMDNDETLEEFLSNYPPIRPECSNIDLSGQENEILYHCSKTVGYFMECLEMDYENTEIVDAINDIRRLEMLLQLWYVNSPDAIALQEYRKADQKYKAKKLADIAKEDEELEF